VVKAIPIIRLGPGVSQAIRTFLADKGIQKPIRIDLNFNGCCDASLCLRADNILILETDLTLEFDGLTFVINPETYQLAGEVTISYVDEMGKKGFVLTSSKPVGEWDGFGVSDIKI
jgi:Fe-S cluster assembly iron-binding protein IscA